MPRQLRSPMPLLAGSCFRSHDRRQRMVRASERLPALAHGTQVPLKAPKACLPGVRASCKGANLVDEIFIQPCARQSWV